LRIHDTRPEAASMQSLTKTLTNAQNEETREPGAHHSLLWRKNTDEKQNKTLCLMPLSQKCTWNK